MKTNILAIVVASALLIIAGCRSNPILNIENAPIEIASKHASKDIKKAIILAGTGLGWKMNVKKSGHIVGTLLIRTHIAVVDVKYSNKNYSITYKSSENLNYDGVNIHKKYNDWVIYLNRQIQVQLSAI